VGEPVDHQVPGDPVLQVERLDRHPLAVQLHLVAAQRDLQVQAGEDLLERHRPADVGAQRQPDAAGDVCHGYS
jgi:hypothetical protein